MTAISPHKRPLTLDLTDECMGKRKSPRLIQNDELLSEDYQQIFSATNSYEVSHSIYQYLHRQNYYLGNLLGTGSSSRVFELLSIDQSEPLALKILKIEKLKSEHSIPIQDNQSGDRLSSSLSHPGIVSPLKILPCERSGEIGGIIMPLAPGKNLREVIETKKLSSFEIAQIGLQLIDALQYLHQKKIIHRDLRLENVIVDHKLTTRLIDLGLARRIAKEEWLSPVGNPAYCAPENRNTFCPIYSSKTDTFAFGVILYKMLREDFNIHPALNIAIKGLLEESPSVRLSLSNAKKLLNVISKDAEVAAQ